MGINYTNLYERYKSGESDIVLAAEVGKSVFVLHSNWVELGLVEERYMRIQDIDWKAYYDEYMTRQVTVQQIAVETKTSVSTIYNKFKRYGYVRKKKTNIDVDQVLKDREDGLEVKDIAIKHSCSTTHIRSILRKHS